VWLDSPGFRKNMLNPALLETGIGIVFDFSLFLDCLVAETIDKIPRTNFHISEISTILSLVLLKQTFTITKVW
jgi:hypothetical protein